MILITVLSSGERLGILGAGGKSGNSSTSVGKNDGSGGSFGGCGKSGIVGIVREPRLSPLLRLRVKSAKKLNSFFHSTSGSLKSRFMSIFTCGGLGSFGSSGSGILVGTKLNSGNKTSIHKSRCEKSRKILGILNFGIGKTGKSTQSPERLQA